MHLRYWGFRQVPFDSKLNVDAFHESEGHVEALARLMFLVQQNRRLGLLLSPSGTGKSLTLEVLARQLRRAGSFVSKANLLGVDADEFLWKLASSIGCRVATQQRQAAVWHAITDRLATLRYQRVSTVVLLDDVDECEAEVLTSICRLAQTEQFTESRLTIVLSCNQDRRQLLGARLLELCELPIEIDPFEEDETREYVVSALKRAGRDEPLFTTDALLHIHEYSRGVPRAINRLADLCLLAGAGEELSQIDAETVRNVRDSFLAESDMASVS